MYFFLKTTILFIGLIFLSFAENLYAFTDNLQELRSLYKEAGKYLNEKKYTAYRIKRNQLGEYALVAYLDYKEIIKKDNSSSKIKDFIDTYPHFPHNNFLHSILLENYYKQKNWQGIIDYAKTDRDVCLQLAAGHALKMDFKSLRAKAEKLWLSGKSLGNRCIDILKKSGFNYFKNGVMVWQRVFAAAKTKNWALVKQLSSYVSKQDRAAYDTLVKLRFGKRKLASYVRGLKDTQSSRDTMVYALTSYPSDYASEGYRIYKNVVEPRLSFNEVDRNAIYYYLGLHMIINDEREGFELMDSLNPNFLEDEEHEWRARSAIKFQQWRKLIAFINRFPPDLASDSAWLYWKGYALEKTGSKIKSRDYYQKASTDRSFYGFLSAEKVSVPKSLNHKPARSISGSSILDTPSFKRFYELNALGEYGKALLEWEITLKNSSREQLLYLAGASYARQWYYHSIRAFAVARYWDDLHRRFPLPYQEEIAEAARQNKLRSSLIYGIMRTESTFRPHVVSSAGAVGLMQILPSTGRSLIRKTRYSGSKKLTNSQTSIYLGSYYLRQLLNIYQGNSILAIASYNAGPYAVKSWLPTKNSKRAVEWLETIPYGETRKYVRTILYSQVIFEWRLGEKEDALSLSRLLQTINNKY